MINFILLNLGCIQSKLNLSCYVAHWWKFISTLKIEAELSSETSVSSTNLQGISSQKMVTSFLSSAKKKLVYLIETSSIVLELNLFEEYDFLVYFHFELMTLKYALMIKIILT